MPKGEEKMNEIVDDLLLKKAIECYELMDQTGLLQLKQAFESDLINNIDTEAGVVFASMREQIIDAILEDRKK